MNIDYVYSISSTQKFREASNVWWMIAPQRFGFEFHILNAWDVVGFTPGFTAEGTSERGDERKDVHGNTIKKAGGAKKAVTLVDSEW